MENPLVIHSNRGIQFTCEKYKELTKDLKRSYSKKGTPRDNAYIESFHALLKKGGGSIDIKYGTMHKRSDLCLNI